MPGTSFISQEDRAIMLDRVITETLRRVEMTAVQPGEVFDVTAAFRGYPRSTTSNITAKLVQAVEEALPPTVQLLGSAGPILRIRYITQPAA